MLLNASAPVRNSFTQPERIGTQTDILGESPLWDDQAQCLYWLDIRRPALRRLCPGTERVDSWPLPGLAGAIALTDDHRLLVAVPQQIVLFDPATGTLVPFVEPPPQPDGHRFNDGRCDAQGRFWVGTMHNVTRAPEGVLYRLEGSGQNMSEAEMQAEPLAINVGVCGLPEARFSLNRVNAINATTPAFTAAQT